MKAISCLFGFALLVVVSGCGESTKPKPSETSHTTVTMTDGQKATKWTVTSDGQKAIFLVKDETNGAPAVAKITAVTLETNGIKVKR